LLFLSDAYTSSNIIIFILKLVFVKKKRVFSLIYLIKKNDNVSYKFCKQNIKMCVMVNHVKVNFQSIITKSRQDNYTKQTYVCIIGRQFFKEKISWIHVLLSLKKCLKLLYI